MARRLLAALALVAGLGTVGFAQTRGGPPLPRAIEDAFRKAYPKATIKNVIKEVANGKTIYEVESVENGRGRNLDYNLDGTVITMEEEMTEAEFPPAVTAAIVKRYPKARVTLRERLTITKGSLVQYEAALTGAGSVTEVILTADGMWVSPKPR